MDINLTQDGAAAMLSLKGFLDYDAAAQLDEAVRALAYVKDLVLDFRNLTGLDTGGLCELVRLDKKMRAKGSFSLINVPGAALGILQRTGLKERLKILS